MEPPAQLSIKDWGETLPFPLASILRTYEASDDDAKEKLEALTFFAEALAQFIAVIFLSALKRNEELFRSQKNRIIRTNNKKNAWLERVDFGSWVWLIGDLGPHIRELCKTDEKLCADLFCDPELKLTRALSAPKVHAILKELNGIRNKNAHGGNKSSSEIKAALKKTVLHTDKLIALMNDVWQGLDLIKAGPLTYNGKEYTGKVKILTSSNPNFLLKKRQFLEPLVENSLCLVSKEQKTAMKLLPLVRMEAAENDDLESAYFYSRLTNKDKLKFVCYHRGGEESITKEFKDTLRVIQELSSDPEPDENVKGPRRREKKRGLPKPQILAPIPGIFEEKFGMTKKGSGKGWRTFHHPKTGEWFIYQFKNWGALVISVGLGNEEKHKLERDALKQEWQQATDRLPEGVKIEACTNSKGSHVLRAKIPGFEAAQGNDEPEEWDDLRKALTETMSLLLEATQ